MIMYFKRFRKWALLILAVLAIPFLLSITSEEVQWSSEDYVIMASALAVMACIYEFATNVKRTSLYKYATVVALLAGFVLFWVNGAVGIIGSEDQSVNLLYAVVIVVLLIGAFYSKLEASGMALTLFATAVCQMIVPLVALAFWPPNTISWSPGVSGVFLLSGFFSVLFMISAWMFRRSALQ